MVSLVDLDVVIMSVRPKRENIDDKNHPLAKAFKEVLNSIAYYLPKRSCVSLCIPESDAKENAG